jgi:hypothetical protein
MSLEMEYVRKQLPKPVSSSPWAHTHIFFLLVQSIYWLVMYSYFGYTHNTLMPMQSAIIQLYIYTNIYIQIYIILLPL